MCNYFSFLTRYCMYRTAIYTIKLPPVIIIYNCNALYKLVNSMCFTWFFYCNKYYEQFKLTLSILDWFNKFMSLRNYVLTAHIVCLKLILIYNKRLNILIYISFNITSIFEQWVTNQYVVYVQNLQFEIEVISLYPYIPVVMKGFFFSEKIYYSLVCFFSSIWQLQNYPTEDLIRFPY